VTELPTNLTLALLDELPEAIAVLDARSAGFPVVLANGALEQLLGRPRLELCRLGLAGLLGEAQNAPKVAEVAELLKRGESMTLRVHPADARGATVVMDLRFQPLRDAAGLVTHYVGFHLLVITLPVSVRTTAAPGGAETVPVVRPPLQRDDRLTGLLHIDFFHELFRRDFAIAQREGRAVTLFVADIDALGRYNTTFGRQAGDSAIRRVGRALTAALRRASDLVTRVEGGRFLGVSTGLDAEHARLHGETLAARVRELHMHHPHSPVARVVTISVGVAQLVPGPRTSPEVLLTAGLRALETARAEGRNRVAAEAPLAD
jgi:diguanylate cyclase (GGDEF)-like protein